MRSAHPPFPSSCSIGPPVAPASQCRSSISMRPVIDRAEQILDCETPGCKKACAACVLTSDAPDGKDDLDRTAALEFLRAHLVFPEELSPDDRFTDGAELSLAPLDEIDRELRRSARSSFDCLSARPEHPGGDAGLAARRPTSPLDDARSSGEIRHHSEPDAEAEPCGEARYSRFRVTAQYRTCDSGGAGFLKRRMCAGDGRCRKKCSSTSGRRARRSRGFPGQRGDDQSATP